MSLKTLPGSGQRETATWLQVNGTSYILVSTGENEKDRRAEITEVIQKIPAQDFVWLDVRARYVGVQGRRARRAHKRGHPEPERPDHKRRGFEITSTDSPAPEAAPAPKLHLRQKLHQRLQLHRRDSGTSCTCARNTVPNSNAKTGAEGHTAPDNNSAVPERPESKQYSRRKITGHESWWAHLQMRPLYFRKSSFHA